MDGQKKKRWGDIIIDKRCTYKEIFQKHMRQKKAYMYMRPRTSSHHTLKEGTRSRGHSSLSFLVAAICAHMLILECIGSCASAQINCSASHPAACANPLKLLPLPTPRCRFPKAQDKHLWHHTTFIHATCVIFLLRTRILLLKKNKARQCTRGLHWCLIEKIAREVGGPTLALFFALQGFPRSQALAIFPAPVAARE